VNSTTGGVPLIGCSTAGEMTDQGPTDGNVVVMALGGEFAVVARVVSAISTRQREAGAEAAAGILELPEGGQRAFLMLMDGFVPEQEEVLRGAYSILGSAVPMVGGCASDSIGLDRTFQFYNNQVLSDALVVAALRSEGAFGVGVAHGYKPVGNPLVVTDAVRNTISSLDDEPALDVYLRRLDAPAEAYTDPEAFELFAIRHSLGLGPRNGQQMRFVSGGDHGTRSITCLADIPRGGVVWLTQGTDEALFGAARSACQDALDALAGTPPLSLVAFDCSARRAVIGSLEGQAREVAELTAPATGVPMAGLYTHGEIARFRGINGFHNQTMVVLSLA
jgi:hypothetical protein